MTTALAADQSCDMQWAAGIYLAHPAVCQALSWAFRRRHEADAPLIPLYRRGQRRHTRLITCPRSQSSWVWEPGTGLQSPYSNLVSYADSLIVTIPITWNLSFWFYVFLADNFIFKSTKYMKDTICNWNNFEKYHFTKYRVGKSRFTVVHMENNAMFNK